MQHREGHAVLRSGTALRSWSVLTSAIVPRSESGAMRAARSRRATSRDLFTSRSWSPNPVSLPLEVADIACLSSHRLAEVLRIGERTCYLPTVQCSKLRHQRWSR